MDPGSGGRLIHPGKLKKINKGETPLHKNPAFPKGDYGEKVATKAFGAIEKGATKAGYTLGRMGHGEVFQQLMATLRRVQGIEANHIPQLEELAVSIVLDLPEFKDAREAWINGDIRIEASIVNRLAPEKHERNMRNIHAPEDSEDDIETIGLNVPEIKGEITQEIHKRRFVNMLIQGAAASKMSAYHLAADTLNQIDPTILKLYGQMVALGDLSYWMKPEDMFGGGEHGGEESIDVEDGVYVVRAVAINFPLLVHELVKGMYEVVAHNVVEDPTIRQHVYAKADVLADEEWHIMKGPAVWAHFNHIINKLKASELIPRVLNHLCSLSAFEFADIVRGIFEETPESQEYLNTLVTEIRAEVDAEANGPEDEPYNDGY